MQVFCHFRKNSEGTHSQFIFGLQSASSVFCVPHASLSLSLHRSVYTSLPEEGCCRIQAELFKHGSCGMAKLGDKLSASLSQMSRSVLDDPFDQFGDGTHNGTKPAAVVFSLLQSHERGFPCTLLQNSGEMGSNQVMYRTVGMQIKVIAYFCALFTGVLMLPMRNGNGVPNPLILQSVSESGKHSIMGDLSVSPV